MSFIKKISLLVFSLVVIVSSAIVASAQNANNTATPYYENPEIYVRDFTLNKSVFEAGETVTGTFTLNNAGLSSVSNIHYEVRLADKYKENNLAGDFYDYKSFGPFYFLGGESKKITFNYTLPKNITGDGLGIQVRAVLGTGGSLSWSDYKIKVSGVSSFMNIDTAEVISGEKVFPIQAGPTLKKDVEAYLQFEIKNPNKTAVTYIPNIKIYERAANNLVSDVNLATSSLLAGEKNTIKYVLPRFGDRSGVYVGEVVVNDVTGSLVAPEFGFRYIVAGPLVTINNLVLDRLSTNVGQTVNGILTYTGMAFDIENPEAPLIKQNYNLNIKIYSLENTLVGEYSENNADLNQGASKNFSITSLIKTVGLRSEVTIKDGDKVITQYFSSFPIDIKNIEQIVTPEPSLNVYLGLLLLFIGLVLVILALNKFQKINKGLIISIIAVFILFGGLIIFKIVTAGVSGGVTYIAPWPLAPTISVSISNSANNWNLLAGQNYYVYGSVWSSACGNESVSTSVYVDGQLAGSGSGGQFCSKTCTREVNFDYASGWKTAPVGGGNYCNYVAADAYQGSKLAASWRGQGCGNATLPPPMIGRCAAAHYNCITPATSISQSLLPDRYTWICPGSYGGANSPLCTEYKPGTCGKANITYPATSTNFTFPLCDLGLPNPSLPVFAAPGNSVSWYCVNNGVNSLTNCTATRNPSLPGACSSPLVRDTCAVGSTFVDIPDITGPEGSYLWNCESTTLGSTTSCVIPMTCNDYIQNQNETGVDAGGVCESYPSGTGNCYDGIKNGSETGIDIGGRCGSTSGGNTSIFNCRIDKIAPSGNVINIGFNTIWQATSTSENITGRDTLWTIIDTNGTSTVAKIGTTTLNYTFTTTGLKALSVEVASTTGYKRCIVPFLMSGPTPIPDPNTGNVYNPASATSSMVQTGGKVREI